MQVREHAVVVVGGGPTGLMLAAELALGGVDVAIVERRADQTLEGTRARGLHTRSIELLDQRGVADRFLEAGEAMQTTGFAFIGLDVGDAPTRHPYGLALVQKEAERLLAGWVEELGVPVLREREVAGLTQDEAGVDVVLAGGSGTVRARYVVGCDGGRSVVRRAAGIDFPGWDASMSSLIAEFEVHEQPELGVRRDEKGVFALGPGEDGRVGAVVREDAAAAAAGAEPTFDDVRAALTDVYGTDFGAHSPAWVSRFTDATRQAAAYRVGRVLLAGDAAHIHSPAGGQGLNLGLHDAVNLGWKLAQVVVGASPETLLDTYHAERHPVAAQALRATMAMTALQRADARTEALRDHLAELLAMEEPRRRFAARLAGLDIAYDTGDPEAHPLLGRRMPDLDLTTSDGAATRVSELLHPARPVLLDLADRDATPLPTRVRRVAARHDAATWELPAVGEVTAPTAVLIRPDGHVAWVGEGTDDGLTDALTTWFGTPAVAPAR